MISKIIIIRLNIIKIVDYKMSFFKKLKTPPTLPLLFLFTFLTINAVSLAIAQEVPEDPSFKERKINEGFTLNLKDLIDKSKKKMEQVDGKLKDQAKERRNQQREEKAREYYDKAMTYYEQGELEAARELWEKAVKITEHDEMEGYLDKSVRRQRKKEKVLEKEEEKRIKRLEVERGYTAKEVNKKYKEGVNLYKDKSYLAAKVVFEEVDQMFPDHRATKSYLALIDRKIEDEQKNIIEDKLNNKELTSAKAKARWKKELEEQEEIRQRNLYKQADSIYKEGVRLYKDKQFSKSKEKFKEVEWILPDYKDTIKYLSKIDKDIAKNGVQFTEEDKLKYFKNQIKQIRKNEEHDSKTQVKLEEVKEFSETRRRQEEAAFVYDAALTLYKKKYYAQALEKFYEVNALSPNYEATQKYIKKLEQKVPENKKSEMAEVKTKIEEKQKEQPVSPAITNASIVKAIDERQKEKSKQAEEKYQQAVKFYNDRNYSEAQRKFIAVEAILPGYKATREYLGHMDGNLSKEFLTAKTSAQGAQPEVKKDKQNKKSDLSGNGGLTKDADYKEKYNHAKRLYRKKEYNTAKQLFVAVNDEKPGYRSTLKYISKINKLAKRNNNNHHETSKIAKLNAQSPTSINNFSMTEKENENKSVTNTEKNSGVAKSGNSLDDVVEKTYSEALDLYGLERFAAAKAKFITVEELSPGYKDVTKYIEEAEQKLAMKENGENFDRSKPLNYGQEVKNETRSKKSEKPALKEQDYIDTQMREVIRFGNESEIKELYNLAKRLYKAKNYQKSKNILMLIQEKYPNYKASSKYLAKIDQLIGDERLQREKFQKLASVKEEQTNNSSAESGSKDKNSAMEDLKIKKQTEDYFISLDSMTREEKKEYKAKQKLFKEHQRVLQEPLDQENTGKMKFSGSDVETKKEKILFKDEPYISEGNSAPFKKRMKKLNKEERLLKAEYDAAAAAESMKDDVVSLPVISVRNDNGNHEPLEGDQDEIEMQEAKKERLQRLEEEQIKEAEDRVAFRREVNLKLKEIEKQKNMDLRKFNEHDVTVKKEEQKRIREEQAKRKEIKKKTLKDLDAIKKETIKLLRKDEPARANEMLFQYEDLIAKGDFTEKERLDLRNALSKEKLKIQKEQEKERFEDERLAYEKVNRTPEDENKLKIAHQRELDEIENRIRAEERKLKAAQRKEEARLKRLSSKKDKKEKNKEVDAEIKKIESVAAANQKINIDYNDRKDAGVQDRKKKIEIEKLVIDRKKELKKKREEIQKEFDKSLVLLYKKAEKYYRQGMHHESGQIFEEIQRLRPGYKNTPEYLSKIYSSVNRQHIRIPQNKTFVKRNSITQDESFVHPAQKDKPSRLEIIKNTLDNFEETMW